MELPQKSNEGGKIIHTSTPIEERFRLFLKIVNNGQMLEQLKQKMFLLLPYALIIQDM